jgi:hypothetical protein
MQTRSTQVLALVGVAIAAAFAVAIAFILAGGSGSTSRADYQATVVNARDRVDFAYGRIASSQSTDELIERLDAAAVVVGSTASDLEDAGVAEGFEDLNKRLVRSLRAFSDVLAGTAAQFRDPTFAGTLPGITSLSFPEWDAVNKVLAELNEQGIEVDQLERH